jgi:hypothetical protein
MALRTILGAGGACALVAGVVVAGSMAGATSMAPAMAEPAGGDVQLASAVMAASDDAATPTPAAGVQALASHRDLLCARVPHAIVRTQNLEKRLAGDASTRGSLAWLQTKIDKAEAAHQDQLVTVLENRLAFRKELASFLPRRLQLLQKAQGTICAPAPAASSPSS